MTLVPERRATSRWQRRAPRRHWMQMVLLLGLAACQRKSDHAAAHTPPEPSAPEPSAPEPRASEPRASEPRATREPASAELPTLRDRAAHAGEVATSAHYAMSFSETKECAMEAHFRPSQGFIKLGVKIDIEAKDALQVPANPFYATLIDASNVVYESTLAGCQPALPARQLVNGQKATGWISFDVPAAAKSLRLAYAPVLLGAGREELLFQLDR